MIRCHRIEHVDPEWTQFSQLHHKHKHSMASQPSRYFSYDLLDHSKFFESGLEEKEDILKGFYFLGFSLFFIFFIYFREKVEGLICWKDTFNRAKALTDAILSQWKQAPLYYRHLQACYFRHSVAHRVSEHSGALQWWGVKHGAGEMCDTAVIKHVSGKTMQVKRLPFANFSVLGENWMLCV